ncbi:ABC transporter substrate-binding protein [Paenirhodobacter enshiensis]|uniref:ABC transporter substrate-binding protein n=1 Tax=Paenirhodobacter enshiensis TaxID=1105367 RepID=UPI0035B25C9A
MKFSLKGAVAGLLLGTMLGSGGAWADGGTLRIAMTAADVPTTTGMPNNGFEGMRFLGYTVFEPLIDWDLSDPSKPADLRPGLAESWEVDPADQTRWTFHLRKGVKFHDGSDFNADAVIWNLDRFFDDKSPQFDANGSAITRGRNPLMKSWKKIDDYTVEIDTKYPASYFPYIICYTLIASPAAFAAAGNDWAKFAQAPAGTGPFRITKVTPRVSVELARNDAYWNPARVPKLDKVVLLPMPEATTRLAALRSGQVDWIEVPPPDAIPSLKSAGFNVVTGVYPHDWPWEWDVSEGSPFHDVRVRQAANYAIDRDGLVQMLNGTAIPAKGWYTPDHPLFGHPKNDYTYDPDKARALLKEAGYGPDHPLKAKILTSTSGSGQMQPVQMNEFIQQNLAEVGIDIDLETTEWGTLLVALRNAPGSAPTMGANAINVSFATSDPSWLAKFFHSKNKAPVSSNWGQYSNPEVDAVLDKMELEFDPARRDAYARQVNELITDDAAWLYVVHDMNPRAMTKKVRGFRPAQSWFQDLTSVSME